MKYILPPVAREPLVGQGLLIVKVSQTHSDTSHSIGLLWTSDQPVAEPPAELEPALPAREWPRTLNLDGVATGIGNEEH